MLSFSVLCPENTEDLKRLMSRRVTLSIAEANGHDTQEALPLPVVEAEKPAPLMIVIPGQPIGKPRMVQSDSWKKRPCVLRYWAWCDKARKAAEGKIPEELDRMDVRAYFAMPDSWTVTKRLQMDGKLHGQKPDWDNVGKACGDALIENDEIIAIGHVEKYWTNGEPRTEVIFS